MLLASWLMIAGGACVALGGAFAWQYEFRWLAVVLWFTAVDLVGSAFLINWRATRPLEGPRSETQR